MDSFLSEYYGTANDKSAEEVFGHLGQSGARINDFVDYQVGKGYLRRHADMLICGQPVFQTTVQNLVGDIRIIVGSAVLLCYHREVEGYGQNWKPQMNHLVGHVGTVIEDMDVDGRLEGRPSGIGYVKVSCRGMILWWRRRDMVLVNGDKDWSKVDIFQAPRHECTGCQNVFEVPPNTPTANVQSMCPRCGGRARIPTTAKREHTCDKCQGSFTVPKYIQMSWNGKGRKLCPKCDSTKEQYRKEMSMLPPGWRSDMGHAGVLLGDIRALRKQCKVLGDTPPARDLRADLDGLEGELGVAMHPDEYKSRTLSVLRSRVIDFKKLLAGHQKTFNLFKRNQDRIKELADKEPDELSKGDLDLLKAAKAPSNEELQARASKHLKEVLRQELDRGSLPAYQEAAAFGRPDLIAAALGATMGGGLGRHFIDHKTVSGRLKCDGPNLQNIPRSADCPACEAGIPRQQAKLVAFFENYCVSEADMAKLRAMRPSDDMLDAMSFAIQQHKATADAELFNRLGQKNAGVFQDFLFTAAGDLTVDVPLERKVCALRDCADGSFDHARDDNDCQSCLLEAHCKAGKLFLDKASLASPDADLVCAVIGENYEEDDDEDCQGCGIREQCEQIWREGARDRRVQAAHVEMVEKDLSTRGYPVDGVPEPKPWGQGFPEPFNHDEKITHSDANTPQGHNSRLTHEKWLKQQERKAEMRARREERREQKRLEAERLKDGPLVDVGGLRGLRGFLDSPMGSLPTSRKKYKVTL